MAATARPLRIQPHVPQRAPLSLTRAKAVAIRCLLWGGNTRLGRGVLPNSTEREVAIAPRSYL